MEVDTGFKESVENGIFTGSTLTNRHSTHKNYTLKNATTSTSFKESKNHSFSSCTSGKSLQPHSYWTVKLLHATAAVLILMYFIIPTFVKLNPWIMTEITFLHRARWPPFIDLTKPVECGLNGTRDFKIQTGPDITLGAWHVLPQELSAGKLDFTGDYFISSLQAGQPIILYLHGNGGTRAGWHRVQLYKVLSKQNCHVIAIDYRGYADSTGYPSEDGLVHDAVMTYKWIKEKAEKSPIYIWGHSMGSGVATKTAKLLNQQGALFTGLILESPFNNIVDAAVHHPFSVPFAFMPWFTWVFLDTLKYNDIHFASDENISRVQAPILILHAEDDCIVPFELGKKLYKIALITKPKEMVHFVSFEAKHGFGHKHIHKSEMLPLHVRSFMEIAENTGSKRY